MLPIPFLNSRIQFRDSHASPFDSLVTNGEREKKKGAAFEIHSSMAIVDNAWRK